MSKQYFIRRKRFIKKKRKTNKTKTLQTIHQIDSIRTLFTEVVMVID